MFKDKKLRTFIIGNSKVNGVGHSRLTDFEIPSNGVEPYRKFTYMTDDGFLVQLIRMIEKLEKRIEVLESKNNKKR